MKSWAEYKKQQRAAKRKAGMVPLPEMWAFPEFVQRIRKFVERLNKPTKGGNK